MLFHASIPADDPEHVAQVIAEPWKGEVLPFPPFPGAFFVCASDARRSIYPRGREHVPALDTYGVRENPAPSLYSEVHLAIGTPLSADDVLRIARRECWIAQRSDRGGLFEVIELWVENRFLLEVLSEPEQSRCRENLTPGDLRTLFLTQALP
jgi:hypothetical protein